MLSLLPERLAELVLVGAHCDDIAIGAGATLLELCRAYPGTRVSALVFTGAESLREQEERGALAALCPGAELRISVLGLTDGQLPNQWRQVKEALRELRGVTQPDLILAPSPHDAHQDHRLIAELVPTAFRDHLTLGYEILKWDGDLAQPGVYLPVAAASLREKVDILGAHYASQSDHSWFDDEAFTGLARIRGVQCNSRYAEGFHLRKLVIAAGPARAADISAGVPASAGLTRSGG
jgi:LmbE family N-acetylglucosaminyl deacetylase